jgi:hypothetical protein
MSTAKGDRRTGFLCAGVVLLLFVLAHAIRATFAPDADPIHLYNGLVLVALGPLAVLLVLVGLTRRAAPRR